MNTLTNGPNDGLLLAQMLLRGELSVQAFCGAFERWWNLTGTRPHKNAPIYAAHAELFEVVIWYCPYPNERARIPNYTSEDDVFVAVRRLLGSVATDAESGD